MAEDKKRIPDIPDIPDELIDFFKSVYNEALANTIADGKLDRNAENFREADHLSVFQHIETVFQSRENELSDEYSTLKTCFLLGIRDAIRVRMFTMGMTNFVEDITVFFMYAIIWLNCLDTNSPLKKVNGIEDGLDMKILSRRKSVESDLAKILKISWEYQCSPCDLDLVQTPIVRDRFGLRLIFKHANSQILLKTTKIIIQILINPESIYCKGFKLWVNSCDQKFGGVPIPKDKINNILNYSFFADFIKDYITNPKDTSYQSWQCTLHIGGTSPILGGFMFELQSQTWDMYKNNEDDDGPASHTKHKIQTTHRSILAFIIENYSDGIVFFDGPGKPNLDMDGITVPASILSRHVSPHVI